jgi:flagellar protein FliS
MTGNEQNNAQRYLEAQVKTASREQLLMMLIDGAIRFTEQAKMKIDEDDLEGMNNFFIKSQKIMLELITSLDSTTVPEQVYGNLIGLYRFVYQRIMQANLKRDKALADEALSVLADIREIWTIAIKQMYKEGAKKLDLIPKTPAGSQGFQAEG